MPAGAGAGTGVVFGMVGAKGDAAGAGTLFWSAEAEAEPDDARNLPTATTPAATTTTKAIVNPIAFDLEAGDFFPPRGLCFVFFIFGFLRVRPEVQGRIQALPNCT